MRVVVVMAILWRRGASRAEARSAVGGLERRSHSEPAAHLVGLLEVSDGRVSDHHHVDARFDPLAR